LGGGGGRTHAVESKFTSVILAIKSAGQFEFSHKRRGKDLGKKKKKKNRKEKP
jgi:hypothetical protein